MQDGKNIRLKRIFSDKSKKTVLIPMDHGVTDGPIAGIRDSRSCISNVIDGGANGIIVHKGLVKETVPYLNSNSALIIHTSASTSIGSSILNKISVCSAEEALCMGADAVSMHINFGSDSESEQIAELAKLSRECNKYGLPLMTMAYVRGNNMDEYNYKNIAHAVRIAAELGSDIVKCNYTGDAESFSYIVEGACNVPVLVAGGQKKDNIRDLFYMVEDSIKAGGSGISMGRNIFQSEHPKYLTEILSNIVHDNLSADEALAKFNKIVEMHNSVEKICI